MLYTLSDQGAAENGHIDGIDAVRRSRPALRRMVLSGHPGALDAYRHNRRAEACIVAANQALNEKRAA